MQVGLAKSKVSIPPNLYELFDAVDTDGSYEIDYTEFLASTMSKECYMCEDHLWSAFRLFDTDGDGKISKHELKQALDNMPGGAVDKMVRDVDGDGDGDIAFDEFKTMVLCDSCHDGCARPGKVKKVR